jgi:hypothetical protein
MADDEQSTSGLVPRLVQEFVSQLRSTTERLEGFGGRLPLSPGAYPLPGALSATQTKALADSIAAQRRSIGALQAQLTAFDEQLAAMEQVIGPLAEWSRAWADLEERLLGRGRGAEPGR